MRFAITIVSPPGYAHVEVFRETAETLHYGLTALGHESLITTEGALPGRQHIVLGSNLLPKYALPLAPDAILYNLEQIQEGSPWLQPELLSLFRSYSVWDYSPANAVALEAMGIRVAQVVPIGYTKELTRIIHADEPDIDVLFVGTVNARRKAILERIVAERLRVKLAFGKYGEERDALIARAKVVLNLHFYDAKVLEMVRISYLLANRCAVLSETSADPAEDAVFEGGIAFAGNEDLPARARALLDAPAERARLAERGFEIMRARPIEAYLRIALSPR
jgi:hypothetical protein